MRRVRGPEVPRIWDTFHRVGADFGRFDLVRPETDQLWPEIGQSRPNLTRVRPKLAQKVKQHLAEFDQRRSDFDQLRPNLARHPPEFARFRPPNSSTCGPKLANFDRTRLGIGQKWREFDHRIRTALAGRLPNSGEIGSDSTKVGRFRPNLGNPEVDNLDHNVIRFRPSLGHRGRWNDEHLSTLVEKRSVGFGILGVRAEGSIYVVPALHYHPEACGVSVASGDPLGSGDLSG